MELFLQTKFLNKKLISFICDAKDFVYLFTTNKLIFNYGYIYKIQIYKDEFNHNSPYEICPCVLLDSILWAHHYFCFRKYKQIYKIPDNICDLACKNKNIYILKKYHGKGYKISDDAFSFSVGYRYNECAKYIYQTQQPIKKFCEIAVGHNNLEILKFLYENNCPWDEETCIACVSEGDFIECLGYLHQNNCPMTQRTLLHSIRSRSTSCTKYIMMTL